MKRLINILICILKAKKVFFVEKKKFVIFDCVNSDIISEILPKDQTFVLSARVNLINKILINFKNIFFLIQNLFSRSIQLNYFISLINQVEPKFVITTIDNSINFSILTKYFENKIKFIAIQNATRGDIFKNIGDNNKNLYYTHYFGFSNFDLSLMRKKNIILKNFFAVGSLRNSYYKQYLYNEEENTIKNFDICLVQKKIFENGKIFSSQLAADTFILLNFLAKYVLKFKKKIIIQSKSSFNEAEKLFIEKLFAGCQYKISWIDKVNFNSYKSISSSELVIGAPSTLLREASVYPKTKVVCFDTSMKIGRTPFEGINVIRDNSYEKFEEKLNLLFKLNYKEYLNKLKNKPEYLMQKTQTINYLLNYLNNIDKKIL